MRVKFLCGKGRSVFHQSAGILKNDFALGSLSSQRSSKTDELSYKAILMQNKTTDNKHSPKSDKISYLFGGT